MLVRKSALSAVQEDARKLERTVGAEDRARLDQYFTGLRDLERRFDLQLTKPDPREACIVSEAPQDLPAGLDFDRVVPYRVPCGGPERILWLGRRNDF